jgi:hypothetical protein
MTLATRNTTFHLSWISCISKNIFYEINCQKWLTLTINFRGLWIKLKCMSSLCLSLCSSVSVSLSLCLSFGHLASKFSLSLGLSIFICIYFLLSFFLSYRHTQFVFVFLCFSILCLNWRLNLQQNCVSLPLSVSLSICLSVSSSFICLFTSLLQLPVMKNNLLSP